MTDHTMPLAGWICSRCGTVVSNYKYECPRCVDEEDSEDSEGGEE